MKMQKRIILRAFCFAIVIAIIFSGIFTSTLAKSKPKSGAKFAAHNPQTQNQDHKKGSNTITSTQVKKFIQKQLTIYGSIAKPQAVFIVPGSDPKVDGLKIDRQFFDLIFRNVEKANLKQRKKSALKNKDYIQW
ncbi:MAG: hypothetical protein GXO74_13525 [Calditrichaeota bacterium]|nr:hypothetical protein [Calditrichota bacterium]